VLRRLVGVGRLLEGDFRPGGTVREWCEPGVLGQIRRRSLAKLRSQVEPVEPAVLGRLVTTWQGLTRPRKGLDALLDVIETLQGAPLPASRVESEILPARIETYQRSDLDALLAAGEVVWCGLEPLGESDGRVALYLTDHCLRLWRPPAINTPPPPQPLVRSRRDADAARAKAEAARMSDDTRASDASTTPSDLGEREQEILAFLQAQGASFFSAIHEAVGGGFPNETVDALWTLVWRGLITNDAWHALRAYVTSGGDKREQRRRSRSLALGGGRPFRSRRLVPPSAEGRWSALDTQGRGVTTATEWSAALAQQLLTRYGVITREVAAAESLPGGFSAVYDVLKALEDSGRIRRGYFVGGVAATQFALPAALDLLRSLREQPEEPEMLLLAATDPANPFGTLLKWPDTTNAATPDTANAADAADAAAVNGDAPGRSRGQLQNNLPSQGQPGRGLTRGASRSVGAQVVMIDGQLAAYLGRGRQLLVYLPEAEPDRSRVARALAARLADIARGGDGREGGLLIGEIDGAPAAEHALAPFLITAGFVMSAFGFQIRRDQIRRAADNGRDRDRERERNRPAGTPPTPSRPVDVDEPDDIDEDAEDEPEEEEVES
jgi:ATP-dependent Lhr-like helicase